jgi:hypothetical protein
MPCWRHLFAILLSLWVQFVSKFSKTTDLKNDKCMSQKYFSMLQLKLMNCSLLCRCWKGWRNKWRKLSKKDAALQQSRCTWFQVICSLDPKLAYFVKDCWTHYWIGRLGGCAKCKQRLQIFDNQKIARMWREKETLNELGPKIYTASTHLIIETLHSQTCFVWTLLL